MKQTLEQLCKNCDHSAFQAVVCIVNNLMKSVCLCIELTHTKPKKVMLKLCFYSSSLACLPKTKWLHGMIFWPLQNLHVRHIAPCLSPSLFSLKVEAYSPLLRCGMWVLFNWLASCFESSCFLTSFGKYVPSLLMVIYCLNTFYFDRRVFRTAAFVFMLELGYLFFFW